MFGLPLILFSSGGSRDCFSNDVGIFRANNQSISMSFFAGEKNTELKEEGGGEWQLGNSLNILLFYVPGISERDVTYCFSVARKAVVPGQLR